MTDKIEPSQVCRQPVLFLAFGFGAGLLPRAPGTAGTAAAIPLYLWFSQYSLSVYLTLVVFVSITGIWLCQQASARLGVHDHPGIVWDEMAGFLVSMLPAFPHWIWLPAGFLLFRLLDIWKPWPISWADRQLEGGLGIMLDDLLAGGIAAVVLSVVIALVG